MKNIIGKIVAIALVVTTLTAPMKAKAGITDSFVFEPTLGCLAAGAAGFVTAEQGDEVLMAAAFCGAGALVGVLLNMHYKRKIGVYYKEDNAKLRRVIKEMELQQAMASANQEDTSYSLKIRKVVPGQKLPNGSVAAPTIIESLVTPGETVRIGD